MTGTEEDLFALELTRCFGRDLGKCQCLQTGGASESDKSQDEVCGHLWCLRGFLFFGLGGLLERSEPDETSKELSDGLCWRQTLKLALSEDFLLLGWENEISCGKLASSDHCVFLCRKMFAPELDWRHLCYRIDLSSWGPWNCQAEAGK